MCGNSSLLIGPDSSCFQRQFVYMSRARQWVDLLPSHEFDTWNQRTMYCEVSCLESRNCWAQTSVGLGEHEIGLDVSIPCTYPIPKK